MAFVLNVLHQEFSLLCTDTRGQTDGPRRMALPRRSAADESPIPVPRVDTLCLNADASLAIGFAGSRAHHAYSVAIEASAAIDDALTIVREYMDDFRTDRGTILRGGLWPEYGGVLSFYDSQRASYYSSWYTFSAVHSYSRVLVPKANGASLQFAGSGGALFESLCDTAKVRNLASSVKGTADLDRILEWVRETYMVVARADSNTGDRPIGVLSMRSDTNFRAISI